MCITSDSNLATSHQEENIFYKNFQFEQSLFQINISKYDIYLQLTSVFLN